MVLVDAKPTKTLALLNTNDYYIIHPCNRAVTSDLRNFTIEDPLRNPRGQQLQ